MTSKAKVKKTNLFSSLSRIGVGLSVCIVLFLLSSCENFLNGKETAAQIEAAIAYANAPSYEIRVECDDGCGAIVTNSILYKKVTDSFEVEFKIADGWQFATWKAYSRTTGGSLTELSSDYISFSNYNTSAADGVYKTRVTFNKYTSGIVIKPVCQELPIIVSYSPENTKTAFVSEPILIHFNIPMEAASTTRDNSLFKYGNISVSINGNSVVNLFEEPVFSQDKKTLILRPKWQQLMQYISAINFVADVKVTFNSSIGVERNGTFLPLKQSENSTIKVTYKAEQEKVAPKKADFFALRKEMSLDEAFSATDKMEMKTIEDIPDSDKYKNICADKIYIYGKYYDGDSGVQQIVLNGEYTHDLEGQPLANSYKMDEKIYTMYSADASFVTDSNGNTSFRLEYSLKGNKNQSGAVRLSVRIIDGCENYAEEFFSVINCTGIEKNIEAKIFNDFPNEERLDGNFYYDFDNWEEDIRTIRIDESKPEKQPKFYADAAISFSDLNYYCEYTDSSGRERKETFSEYDSETKQRRVILDIDSVALRSFKVTACYDEVVVASEEVSFPKNVTLKKGKYLGSTGSRYEIISNNQSKFEEFRVNTKEGPYQGIYKYNYGKWGHVESDDTRSYYFINYNSDNDNFIYGELYGPFVPKELTFTLLQTPEIVSWELKKSTKSGYADLVITTSDEWWNTYDTLYLDYYCKRDYHFGDYNTYVQQLVFFEKNKNSATLNIPLWLMCKGRTEYDYYLRLKGEKEGHESIEKTKALYYGTHDMQSTTPDIDIRLKTDADKARFDNDDPYLSGLALDSGYCNYVRIGFGDSTTGPAEDVKVEVNGLYSFDANNKNKKEEITYAHVQMWSMHPGVNTYVCDMKDKTGKTVRGEGTFTVSSFKLLDNTPEKGKAFTKPQLSQTTLRRLYRHPSQWNTSNPIQTFQCLKFENGSWKQTMGLKNYNMDNKITYTSTHNSTTYFLAENTTIPDFPENSFIRLHFTDSLGCMFYEYYYTGAYTGSGEYNLLLANGTSKTSLAISSDAPVLVTSLAKKDSYELCKSLSAEDWLNYGRPLKEEILSFSSTNSNLKRYNIPVDKLESDDTCYCVVAVFQDNTILMSEVMEK